MKPLHALILQHFVKQIMNCGTGLDVLRGSTAFLAPFLLVGALSGDGFDVRKLKLFADSRGAAAFCPSVKNSSEYASDVQERMLVFQVSSRQFRNVLLFSAGLFARASVTILHFPS